MVSYLRFCFCGCVWSETKNIYLKLISSPCFRASSIHVYFWIPTPTPTRKGIVQWYGLQPIKHGQLSDYVCIVCPTLTRYLWLDWIMPFFSNYYRCRHVGVCVVPVSMLMLHRLRHRVIYMRELRIRYLLLTFSPP